MRTFHTIVALLGIGLLGYLIIRIGLHEPLRGLSLLGWGIAPLIFLQGLEEFFHTLGWRYCLSPLHRRVSLHLLFRIRLSGVAFNYLTPTATMGGEVIKAILLGEGGKNQAATASVLVGKMAFVISQMVCAGLGTWLAIGSLELPKGMLPALLLGSTVILLGVLSFLLIQRYGKIGALMRWVESKGRGGRTLKKASDFLTGVDYYLMDFYKLKPWGFPMAMLGHILGFVCSVARIWLFLLFLMGNVMGIKVAIAIWSLGTWFDIVSFMVPAYVGVQEGSRVVLFKAAGLSSGMGLTFSIVLRIQQLFWATVGLIIYRRVVRASGRR